MRCIRFQLNAGRSSILSILSKYQASILIIRIVASMHDPYGESHTAAAGIEGTSIRLVLGIVIVSRRIERKRTRKRKENDSKAKIASAEKIIANMYDLQRAFHTCLSSRAPRNKGVAIQLCSTRVDVAISDALDSWIASSVRF
jgi:hypothetical protein